MTDSAKEGFIFSINKPKDWTSFDVVKKLRGITRIKKIGHAGTLDPFATGVLLLCIGKATKQIHKLMDLPKEYEAQLELGAETDTLDITGKVVNTRPVPSLSPARIQEVLEDFKGKITQRIPDYSAAKVGGRRLYKLAREGKAVPERYKDVEIYDIKFFAYKNKIISFSVLCSRGTYVRTLGSDIARKLGTVGHIKSLVRTKIGEYTVENSLDLLQFEQQWKQMIANENISQH